MKERMFYFQYNIRDYLTKTRHLSLLEDLAYRRCLDTYYTQEGPLPADPARVARLIAMPDHVAEITVVLNEFFTLTEQGWANARADEEIAKFRSFADAGRRGAEKRWSKGGDANPNGGAIATPYTPPIATNNHKPITKNHKPTPKKQEPVSVDGFFEFWTAYPKKVAKPEAMKAWLKAEPDAVLVPQIMAGLARAKQSKDWTKDDGQYIPHPTTWLNQRRWEDELEGASASGEDHFGGLI